VSIHAPAKINLYLNVIGRRSDGYHELDSLVGFTAYGDLIQAKLHEKLYFQINGPFGSSLQVNDDNLIVRAARALVKETSYAGGAHITLKKNLPVASGIGGGSADAAATLKALNLLWKTGLVDEELAALGLKLGADIPVCILGKAARMSGIGESVSKVENFPSLGVLLINSGIPISTFKVFHMHRGNFSSKTKLQSIGDTKVLYEFLAHQKNDLQDLAIQIAPGINEVLDILSAEPDCRLVRLSGSGATCFGLFDNETLAKASGRSISRNYPNWWVQPTHFIS
jgi:4-diphosphocytidyl-2-C-methyl-D-erythritol kinase